MLVTCSLPTLGVGGDDTKADGWVVAVLALAALDVAAGLWELPIARSMSPRG